VFDRRTLLRASVALSLALALAGFARDEPEHLTGRGQWRVWGGNLHNTHHAEEERVLGPDNVARLVPKWVFHTAGNVSAIPTVSDGVVYVPDWGIPLLGGGKLHAIDAERGRALWSKPVLGYTRSPLNSVARSSPAIADDLLIFGDLVSQPSAALDIQLGHGAWLYAVRRSDGGLVWKKRLDPHPLALVTASPVVHDGVIIATVSSLEEPAARIVGHNCCTFRGSVVALELETGNILWQTYTQPDNHGRTDGYAGGAIWGSSPAIDARRDVVYVATGNDYTYPRHIRECIDARQGDPAAQDRDCYSQLDPQSYGNSVLALELGTGRIRWAQKFQNYGAWTFACEPRIAPFIPNILARCDDLDALDFDFGQSPMLYTTTVNGVTRDLLGIGQKSGVTYALDPDTGSIVWATRVGPGAALGGMEFGAATDGERIYVQNTNFDHVEFQLVAGPQRGRTVRGGMWAALDAATGELLWQTPDPSSDRPLTGWLVSVPYGPFKGPGFFAATMGPMTVANGVVYAGSMDPEGHMYALDARTGEILWSFASGGSVMSAPSVVDGVLYWGSGYSYGTNSNKLYAFALPR
jgi:polyvinyl alcohol dehydrogenase (cytochrome)